MAKLQINHLGCVFGKTRAVDDLSLTVDDGELVCLLGPSGSGKSTVLRMIGGFEHPTSGSILIDGQDVTRIPPERRPTGMVFQNHALWTHMTVFDNIAFGLKLRRLPKNEIRQSVEAALTTVSLEGFGDRNPSQLSGGQQQRVALARSLVLKPKILLLDEPFASLDQHLRERLREEVRDIQQKAGITMIFVTHGQDEALAIADRVAVMRNGKLEQMSRPDMLYRRPQTEFVAGFVGQMNLMAGEVRSNIMNAAGINLPVILSDGSATLALRPEDLKLEPSTDPYDATILRVTHFGTHLAVEVETTCRHRLKVLTSPDSNWSLGQQVSLSARKYALYREGKLCFMSSPSASNSASSPTGTYTDVPMAHTVNYSSHMSI